MDKKFVKMKQSTLRKILLFWELFIGIGALFGGGMMLIEPTGKIWKMDLMLPYFQVLPYADILFQNFIVPGIALLLVNGLSNGIAAYLLIRKKKYASLAGMICGIFLMLWICIQFYIFPLNFMSSIYFVFGLLQALTGYLLYKRFGV